MVVKDLVSEINPLFLKLISYFSACVLLLWQRRKQILSWIFD